MYFIISLELIIIQKYAILKPFFDQKGQLESRLGLNCFRMIFFILQIWYRANRFCPSCACICSRFELFAVKILVKNYGLKPSISKASGAIHAKSFRSIRRQKNGQKSLEPLDCKGFGGFVIKYITSLLFQRCSPHKVNPRKYTETMK